MGKGQERDDGEGASRCERHRRRRAKADTLSDCGERKESFSIYYEFIFYFIFYYEFIYYEFIMSIFGVYKFHKEYNLLFFL